MRHHSGALAGAHWQAAFALVSPPGIHNSDVPLRVVIVEDNAAFAAELIGWLEATPDLSVLRHCPSAERALQELPALKPQIAIVDLKLPGMGGVELMRRVKRLLPDLTCIVLTQFEDSDLLFAALAAGADSYLLKHDSPERILAGIRDAQAGGSVMSPSIGRKVLNFFQDPAVPAAVRAALSPRQIEILQLARRGKNAKDIAVALGLSSETVRTHFRNIYRALQVHGLNQALDRTFPNAR